MRATAAFSQSSLHAAVRVTISLLLAFSSASICSAQDVSVLLVNIRNGHPIQNEKVRALFAGGGTDVQPLEANPVVDGDVKFLVTAPTPAQLTVQVNRLYPWFNMSPNGLKEILTTGIVSRCSKPPQGC